MAKLSLAAASAVTVAVLLPVGGLAGSESTTLSRESEPSPPPATANLPDPHFVAAQLAAEALLTVVRLPPGAAPVSSTPPGAPALAQPAVVPGTPYLVDRSVWWTVPGTLDAVMTWVRAHAPPGGELAGTGLTSQRGIVEWQTVGWRYPPQEPAVTGSQLSVTVAPDGPGTVGIRADAQVIWDPLRTSASMILPAVTSITVTEQVGSDGFASTSTTLAPSVTLTSAAAVARYVRVVDALPVTVFPILNCPAWTGLSFQLVFATENGDTVATLNGTADQCGGYELSVNGIRQPPVSDPNETLLHMVATTLGITLASAGEPTS
jgi:hypothetical protein